jgi:hypothetical protein
MSRDHRPVTAPFVVVTIAIVGMLHLAGCRDDGLNLAEVSGSVTLDGKPVPNAFITFTPQASGRSSMAKSDENGNYELRFNPTRWGALVGEHHVTISTEDRTPDDRIIPEIIPKKYRSSDGFIAVTVEPGENVLNLQLTTDGDDRGQTPTRGLTETQRRMIGE